MHVAAFGLLTALLVGASACSEPDRTASEPQSSSTKEQGASADQRPNILLIVVDDIGYTDLGFFGSEIKTPNLDALASEGFVFTQFYTSPMCSPTRAMLLSGVDNHLSGLGNMVERLADNQKGHPGYEGRLNNRVLSLAEVLGDSGYRTYMTGKWHLGSTADKADPSHRGFAKSFALLDSGAGAFDNMLPLMGPEKAEYSENGVKLQELPEDFYSTRFYTQKLIEYLDQDKNESSPFFAYLAFTSAHFPLQAPEDSIARYKGAYDDGYDVLHAKRMARTQELGLIAKDVKAFPPPQSESSWEELAAEEKAYEARRMEIYAAMIDDLDRYVGTLVDYLKAEGEYENTAIFFMSDNGAEGHYLRQGLAPLAGWAEECCNNSFENMGKPDSYVMLGPNWARASVAPFRMFKGFTSEGGIRTPAFVHYPKEINGGETSDSLVTVKDVMPTLLELADTRHPGQSYQGRELITPQGSSMMPMIQGQTKTVHQHDFVMGWELFGKRAIRNGDWKIIWETSFVDWWNSAELGIKRDAWQLYHLPSDPAELTDLSQSEPEQLDKMIALWGAYARENGVIIPDKARGY